MGPSIMTRPQLSAADRSHRAQFADYARHYGSPEHRAVLDPLYDLWEEWNAQFFERRMVLPHLLLLEPKSPRALGDHANISGWGSRNQIRIRPSLLTGKHPSVREGEEFAEGRFLFIADILLHETIHQYQEEVTGLTDDGYKGHGPAFRDECNRIGALLGLPPVRIAKARGSKKEVPSCAEWPHCVRQEGYYLGASVYKGGTMAKPEPKSVPVPKRLARWMDANPDWAREYVRIEVNLAAMLDDFFSRLPAPPAVVEQAVKHALRNYLLNRRTEA